jgi:hypothetical protein
MKFPHGARKTQSIFANSITLPAAGERFFLGSKPKRLSQKKMGIAATMPIHSLEGVLPRDSESGLQ